MQYTKNISNKTGKLFFSYLGTPKEEFIDDNEIINILDKIFDNNYFGNDLKRILTYLKTILINYEEEFLLVEVSVSNAIERSVVYRDKSLVMYDSIEKIKESSKDDDKLKFHYDANGNSSFSFSNESEDLKEYLLKEELKEFVLSEIDYVFYLKNNVKPVKLDNDGKIIITIYNLFYGELPDLSDLNIEAKLQNMLYILSLYGITIKIKGDDLCFARWGKFPESPILGDWLREGIPLATNVEALEISKFNKESVEIITMVGTEIRNSFLNDSSKNLSFERFCYAVYCKNYVYRSNISLKELAEKIKNDYFGEFCEEELEYYFELVEKMCKKYKEMFIE